MHQHEHNIRVTTITRFNTDDSVSYHGPSVVCRDFYKNHIIIDRVVYTNVHGWVYYYRSANHHGLEFDSTRFIDDNFEPLDAP